MFFFHPKLQNHLNCLTNIFYKSILFIERIRLLQVNFFANYLNFDGIDNLVHR